MLQGALTRFFPPHICTAHLPQLAPLIHDTAERVRVAFIDLLCEIKTIRAIRFYDIVPIEHLLTRLELGAPLL